MSRTMMSSTGPEQVNNFSSTEEKIIASICVFAEKPVTDEYYAILVKDVEGLIKV